MNILHIFASPHWGGGEQYVFDLASRQKEAGHNLTLAFADSKIIEEKVAVLNCSVHSLKNRWYFNPFSIATLRQIMRKEKIAVAHVHQFRDAFIAVLAAQTLPLADRPKIIMTRHMIKRGKNNFLYRYLYRRLTRIIFVSEIAQREFSSTVKLPADKTIVIHNSIIQRSLAGAAPDYRRELGLSSATRLLGFIGAIAPHKGVEILLDVAERLREKNVAFLLAGTGNDAYVNYLRDEIRRRQLPVFLLGFLANPHEFAAQMEVGVLPSLWREPFGLSILDFMSMGVPVITTNTGGQVEFVDNEQTGLLVAPTAAAVTEALTRLLTDENQRKNIGEKARQVFNKRLNYEIFFTKIMDVYNTL